MQNRLGFFSALLVLAVFVGCVPQDTASAGDAAKPPTEQAVARVAMAAEPEPVCLNCGVIRAINLVTEQGQASGAGVVIGAIVGGVAGSQVGGGSGQDIATVAGAIGGALLGNSVERTRNAVTFHEVLIDMDNGSQQRINIQFADSLRIGDAVRLIGGNIHPR
jgi:outer membrane lipoprotein SlyB